MQQVNGGSIEDKVDFAYNLFEQTVSVDSVFQPNEMLDTIAITKGKGTEGVVTRWGVTRLPRKTHRGLRKVGLAHLALHAGYNYGNLVRAVCCCVPSFLCLLASCAQQIILTPYMQGCC